MNAPGSVTVSLQADADCRISAAKLHFQPIQDPAPLMRRRAPGQALAIVDALFGVCRHAHRYAATCALGLAQCDDELARLRHAALAESVRETVFTLGVRWPKLVDAEGLPVELVRDAVGLVNAVAGNDADAGACAVQQLQDRLQPWFLASEDATHTRTSELAGGGWLAAMVREIDALEGPMLPLPDDLRDTYPGRLFLAQAQRCLANIETLRTGIDAGTGAASPLSVQRGTGDAGGIAAVETSRGRLIHRAHLDEAGQVLDYQIDAPTTRRFENIAALRPAVAALQGLQASHAARVVGNWLGALDPCGGASVEWSGSYA